MQQIMKTFFLDPNDELDFPDIPGSDPSPDSTQNSLEIS